MDFKVLGWIKYFVGAGVKERYNLGSSDSPSMKVFAKSIDPKSLIDRAAAMFGILTGRFIKLEDGSSHLILNINSVSKRLCISKEEVKHLIQHENALNHLLKEAKKTAAVFGGCDVSEILEKGRLTPKELLSMRVKSEELFLEIDEIGQVAQVIFKNEGIGKGGYANIYSAHTALETSQTALKLVSDVTDIEAIETIETEIKVTHLLNPDGTAEGLQKIVKRVQQLMLDGGGMSPIGHIGPLYKGNYRYVPLYGNYLDGFRQLLSGLTKAHHCNIVHRDLKPENIFWEWDEKRLMPAIGDWGVALIDPKNLEEVKNFASHPYALKKDISKEIELCEGTDVSEYLDLVKKRDVFSMGMVFFEKLNDARAYSKSELEGETPLDPSARFVNSSVPNEVKDLILRMIDWDPSKRPSAEGALTTLKNLL